MLIFYLIHHKIRTKYEQHTIEYDSASSSTTPTTPKHYPFCLAEESYVTMDTYSVSDYIHTDTEQQWQYTTTARTLIINLDVL